MMMCRERWGGPLSVPFGAWEVCPNDAGPRRCQARHAATAKGGGEDFCCGQTVPGAEVAGSSWDGGERAPTSRCVEEGHD